MGGARNKETAILLPHSSVAVFSRDHETLEAIGAVVQDWRFARVKIEASEGDVATAIDVYKDIPSPDLLIVQTDSIDESLTGRLEELSMHCNEGTSAIVIGPVNDVYLYRQLIEMGISDYLVRPVKTDIISDVIAKTMINRIGVKFVIGWCLYLKWVAAPHFHSCPCTDRGSC